MFKGVFQAIDKELVLRVSVPWFQGVRERDLSLSTGKTPFKNANGHKDKDSEEEDANNGEFPGVNTDERNRISRP